MAAKRTLACTCQNCGNTFMISPCQVKHGEGKFCSRICYNTHRKIEPFDKFWPNVQKGDDCWSWIGAKRPDGYGVIYAGQDKSNMLAHRASWEIHNGPIPKGMVICHRCDNPNCVRPDHLFLGTQPENIYDAQHKGRLRKGEGSHYAKLTEPQVIEIIALGASGLMQQDIAIRFAVHPATVGYILRNKTWKHIPRP